jgi:hypothetical protein
MTVLGTEFGGGRREGFRTVCFTGDTHRALSETGAPPAAYSSTSVSRAVNGESPTETSRRPTRGPHTGFPHPRHG